MTVRRARSLYLLPLMLLLLASWAQAQPTDAGTEEPPPEPPPEATQPSSAPPEAPPPQDDAQAPSAQDEAEGEAPPAATSEPPEPQGSATEPAEQDTPPAPQVTPPPAVPPGGPAPGAAPPEPTTGEPTATPAGPASPTAAPKVTADALPASSASPAANATTGPHASKGSDTKEEQQEEQVESAEQANMAASGVVGASGDGGRLLYRFSVPWDHSVTWATFFKDLTPSYNPTYSWGFTPNVVYFATDRTWLFASQGLNVEITDSDSTTERQQLLLSDLNAGFLQQLLVVPVTEGQTTIWSINSSAYFPVSKASQAATRIVGLDAGTSLRWIFNHVLNSLTLQASTRFRLNANQSKVGIIDAGYPCTPLNQAPDQRCRTGYNANSLWSWNLGLGAQLIALPNLFLTGGFSFTTRHIYALSDAEKMIEGGDPAQVPFRGATQFGSYSLSMGATYLPLSMMSLTLSLSNLISQRGPDARLRGPFDAQDVFIDFIVSVFLDGTEDTPDSRGNP